MRVVVFAFLAMIFVSPTIVWTAEINPVLNYQGYLSDSTGVPLPDSVLEITFGIYQDSLGGIPLWCETQSLEVKRGILHAYLGSVQSFPAGLFETYPLYLGIKSGNEPEFTPRHLLSSSVYAFLAANSKKLEGYPASHFVDSFGLQNAIGIHTADESAHHTKTTDASELTSGTLHSDRLPQNGIDSLNVRDGGIATVDLADSAVTSAKIASGAITSEHLSVSAFTGDNITDGSLTAVDLADSTITGNKIAPATISSVHLSASSLTGDNIQDGSLTGADIADGSIGSVDITGNGITSFNIADGTITGDDIATATISGIKIIDGSIGSADLGYSIVGTAQIVDNAVRSIDVKDNSLTSADMLNEPGLDYVSSGWMVNVDTTVTNWMTLTIAAPSVGYVIAYLNCVAQISSGETAQAGISNSATILGSYGEAMIFSTALGTGANMTISVSEVFPVAAAGPVTIYANVRAAAISSGNVDFSQGRLQAIFIPTAY